MAAKTEHQNSRKTIFYFAILVVLVYLYSYSGIGGASFIYKDF